MRGNTQLYADHDYLKKTIYFSLSFFSTSTYYISGFLKHTSSALFFLNSPLSVIFLFTYCYSRNFLIAITSSLHIPLNFHPTIVFSVYHCLVFGNFGFRFLQTIQQRFKVVATIPKYLRRDLPQKNISSAGNSPN